MVSLAQLFLTLSICLLLAFLEGVSACQYLRPPRRVLWTFLGALAGLPLAMYIGAGLLPQGATLLLPLSVVVVSLCFILLSWFYQSPTAPQDALLGSLLGASLGGSAVDLI